MIMNSHSFIYLFLLIFLAWGCEDEAFGPVLKIGNAPGLVSPNGGSSYVLEEAKANDVMTTFQWTAADFGFSAGVKYTVEIAMAGTNFASPITLGVVNALELAVTQGQINNILLSQGVEEALPTNMVVRIIAEVSDEISQTISDELPMTVTPYIVEIDYPTLGVPGSYQGWDPANESTVIFSLKSDGIFEGFVFMTEGALFKFTDGPSWDVNWGDTGLDGILDPNGDDIPLPASDGMYQLKVDINALTYQVAQTNWGVIGDATPTGWDADTDMVYDEASGTLKVTLDLGTGFIKFRANDDWGINMGDNDTNGSLEYGGADIPIEEAGNYTIELILNVPKYTYQLTKN